MRALPINIYENKRIGNCSNNGISSRYNDVLLICEEGFIKIDENNPPENLVKLVTRRFGGREYKHLESYAPVSERNVGYMAGGCYCGSSDSRFTKISDYPLPLHDRQETQEMYDSMFN